jgi:hypothetical protein
MSRKYRDSYAAKMKGAIPEDEGEAFLFGLARMEEDAEQFARIDDLVGAVAKKMKGGAPPKTAGDAALAQQLLREHGGNVRFARRDFTNKVAKRDKIGKKRASERFNRAVKNLNT